MTNGYEELVVDMMLEAAKWYFETTRTKEKDQILDTLKSDYYQGLTKGRSLLLYEALINDPEMVKKSIKKYDKEVAHEQR